MKQFFKTLLLLAVLMTGCDQIGPSADNYKPKQPEGFSRFQTAYAAGYGYSELSVSTDSIRVTFAGGPNQPITAAMRLEHIFIEDVSGSSPKICAVNSEGFWLVGGIPTKMPKDEKLLDSQAIPFYITYAE